MQSAARRLICRIRFIAMCKKLLPRYATPVIQHAVRQHQKRSFLKKIAAHIKKLSPQWHRIDWPKCLAKFKETSDLIRTLVYHNSARRYRLKLSDDRKAVLTEKDVTSGLFKDKKSNYPAS